MRIFAGALLLVVLAGVLGPMMDRHSEPDQSQSFCWGET